MKKQVESRSWCKLLPLQLPEALILLVERYRRPSHSGPPQSHKLLRHHTQHPDSAYVESPSSPCTPRLRHLKYSTWHVFIVSGPRRDAGLGEIVAVWKEALPRLALQPWKMGEHQVGYGVGHFQCLRTRELMRHRNSSAVRWTLGSAMECCGAESVEVNAELAF